MPPNDTDIAPGIAPDIAKDFQDFVYIISHDFGAPLRHIKQFTQLLLNEREGELSETEQSYAGYIESSIERLEAMQDALLAFSRVTTQTAPMEAIDCNALVQRAVDGLNPGLIDETTEIKISPLPTVTADAEQLRMVFYYLIDNALKFHDGEDAKICTITADNKGDHTLFEVSDNGIGMENKFKTDIFKIFRRLHAGDDFGGIGAGLALTKKIVTRHGGTIWVDTKPDQGTTICFTLPKT